MDWNDFILFGGGALLLWLVGALTAYRPDYYKRSLVFYLTGITLFAVFVVGLWVGLERPPMRTLGETRLLYSLFVSLVGLGIYIRWRFVWILSFSTLLSAVFIAVNIFKPEIHDKTLLPVLQSQWFIPHVIVYMFAYGTLGSAFLLTLYTLWQKKRQEEILFITDRLVYIGTGLLTSGMLFGALWAKDAWGQYWGWDPKETWAALTWLSYLAYIHLRYRYPGWSRAARALLIAAFLFLQICWYGINYLPSATESAHTYFEIQE